MPKPAVFFYSSCAIAVIGLLLHAAMAPAQNLPDVIETCEICVQHSDYASAAAIKVPSAPSRLSSPLVWSVYVVNPHKSHVEAFEVLVQPTGSNKDAPAEFLSKSSHVYEFGRYKTVRPVEGDPETKSAMLSMADVVQQFPNALISSNPSAADASGSNAENSLAAKNLTNIDSAIKLAGATESARLARMQLESDLEKHFETADHPDLLETDPDTERTSQAWLKSALMEQTWAVALKFTDGTSVNAILESTHPELNKHDGFARFEVLAHTARLPNGSPVPQTAAQFSDYSWEDSAGGSDIAARLSSLAELYGLKVGEPGQAQDCSLDCISTACSLSCAQRPALKSADQAE